MVTSNVSASESGVIFATIPVTKGYSSCVASVFLWNNFFNLFRLSVIFLVIFSVRQQMDIGEPNCSLNLVSEV